MTSDGHKVLKKLTIEMVPKSAWNVNLRSVLSSSQWDKVRRKSYELANGRCDICNSKQKRLSCHEVWSYDDETGTQYLVRLEALCNRCHMGKHIGFAFTKHFEGSFDMMPIIEHFMNVNGMKRNEFDAYLLEEVDIWAERSKKVWTLDIGYLQEFTEKHGISL